jgi:hypothetical protein
MFLKPLSAMMQEVGGSKSKNPDCLTISTSDVRPLNPPDTYDTLPFGVQHIKYLIVHVRDGNIPEAS